MNWDIRQRLKWVQMYRETSNAGLESRSRRPHHMPAKKVGSEEQELILSLRNHRNLGARRIQSELKRECERSLSLDTIHKVLTNANVKPLVRLSRKKEFVRYARPIPGERVQMDTCKIAPGCYQFTAVDDCTRYRVLAFSHDVRQRIRLCS